MSRKPRSKSPTDQPPMRPCAACGWDVLVATADKTGGYCFECQWLTTGEACSILRIHRDVLRALGVTGKVTCLKITSRLHRWLRLDVDHLHSGRQPFMKSHRSTWGREEVSASPYPMGQHGRADYGDQVAA